MAEHCSLKLATLLSAFTSCNACLTRTIRCTSTEYNIFCQFRCLYLEPCVHLSIDWLGLAPKDCISTSQPALIARFLKACNIISKV